MTIRYRDKQDIICRVLEVAIRGAPKRKIMYESFLPYDRLAPYLKLLAESYLLMFDETLQVYITTSKGQKLLEAYNEIANLVKYPD